MGFFPKETAQICAQVAGTTLTGLRQDERVLGPTIVLLKDAGTLYERIAGGINERGKDNFRIPPALTPADCERLYKKWKPIPASVEFKALVGEALIQEHEKRQRKQEMAGKQSWATTVARRSKNQSTGPGSLKK